MLLKKVNKLVSGFLVMFGIGFLYLARTLEFGSFAKPNTGFMPKLFSVLMITLAILNFIFEMCRPDQSIEMLQQVDWKKAGLYIGACVLYVVLLLTVGYLVATLATLFAMIKFTGIKGFLIPALTTIGVSGFFYFIFYKLLSVPLPQMAPCLSEILPFM